MFRTLYPGPLHWKPTCSLTPQLVPNSSGQSSAQRKTHRSTHAVTCACVPVHIQVSQPHTCVHSQPVLLCKTHTEQCMLGKEYESGEHSWGETVQPGRTDSAAHVSQPVQPTSIPTTVPMHPGPDKQTRTHAGLCSGNCLAWSTCLASQGIIITFSVNGELTRTPVVRRAWGMLL